MDGSVPWTCGACTFRNDGSTSVCSMCNTDRRSSMNSGSRLPLFHNLYHHSRQQQQHNLHDQSSRRRNSLDLNSSSSNRDEGRIFSFSMCTVPRLLAGALSGALTGMFAVVGAFTGAVTGALAGRATDSGLLRGAGLGAVAGAVLSVEVLEASRAYWHSEQSGSHQPSVAEFIEDFLNGRFAQDQHTPSNLSSNHWQVNVAEMSYEDLYEMFGPGESSAKGASEACIGKLPQHIVTDDVLRDAFGENVCCAICLQELMKGEIARCLPLCSHVFHMCCVDKWLVRHGSCPICRQEVQIRA